MPHSSSRCNRGGKLFALWLSVTALLSCNSCGERSSPSNRGSSGSAGSAGSSGSAGAPEASGTGGSAAGASGSGGIGGALAGSASRPELTSDQAADYTILKYLAKAGVVSALVTDNWDPTAGVGDAAGFSSKYKVAASGGTHTTVQQAIDAAVAAGGTERVHIEISAGTYRELVCVPVTAPPITLYGSDADPSKTSVVFDNYAGKPKGANEPANPCSPSAGATTHGTSGSATFAVFANDFRAKNLTISNDIDESTITGAAQAVALMTQGDKLVFENVRLLGNQDTFHAKTSSVETVARVYLKGSYVEGDVDFIFGRATIVLDGCTIKSVSTRQSSSGYVAAPSSDSRNPYGILISGSTFTADTGIAASVIHLGRAWDESQVDVARYATNVATGVYPNGQALIRESTLGGHVRAAAPWAEAATTKRPFSSTAGTYPANRLYEYANTGPGSSTP